MGIFAWNAPKAAAAAAAGSENESENESEALRKVNQGAAADPSYGATPLYETETLETDDNDDNGNNVQSLLPSPAPPVSSWFQRLYAFYQSQLFLVRIATAIVLARLYPPLGATYLAPQVTASWIAVWIIFVLAGLGLPTQEFARAWQRWVFNLFVQAFNFVGVSAIVFVVSRGLEHANWISADLADGMIICACLPMAINTVLVMTKAAHGDEAAAVFNVVVANLVGVMVSPFLMLTYLGVHGTMQLNVVYTKMALCVLLPIAVGQTLQKRVPAARNFGQQHAAHFKKTQEWCLIFIVYTVFCKTFQDGTGNTNSMRDVAAMICCQALLLSGISLLAWHILGMLFANEPRLRVMGLFGCTYKTMAAGVPMLAAMYNDNPAVGTYTLPLLIWHPLQLLLGSFLAPWLARYVEREEKRLSLRVIDENGEDALLV